MEHAFRRNEDYSAEGFFVTVFSNVNEEFITGNSSSSFTNKLSVPLQLDGPYYEVGLTEIFFHDNYKQDNTGTEPKNNTNLANPQESDKTTSLNNVKIPQSTEKPNLKITTYAHSQADIQIKTQQKTATSFLASLRLELEEKNKGIDLTVLNVKKQLFAVLEFDIEGTTLVFPQTLSKTLGFETTAFRSGKYIGITPITDEDIQNIPEETLYIIYLSKWIESTKALPKYEEDDLDSTCDDILDVLNSESQKVRMFPNKDGSVLHVYIDDPKFKFRLPEIINKSFGLTSSFIFELASQEIYLPRRSESNISVILNTKPIEIKTNDQLHIACNLIKPQYFGSTLLPILRTIPRNANNDSETHLVFQPVYFMPLKSENLSYIDIQILDDKLNIINPSLKPTTTILHFRPRRI